MDIEKKINFCEGVPLHTSGAANIFLNTNSKNQSQDGTVIHLKTEKPADVGVHINTTFAIASSKKIKLLFVLNFLLSVVCMVVSCSVAFYYWNEMISMRRQLDTMKDQFVSQNIISQPKIESSALVSERRPYKDLREPRVEKGSSIDAPRRYYVEDLGEDMLLVDSRKKSPNTDKAPVIDLPILHKDPLIAHFTGALREINLGSEAIIGPWALDKEVSSKNSHTFIEPTSHYFKVKESGLYLVYAQIVYHLSRAPSCYFIWATQPSENPRLLSTCATGEYSTSRPLDKSQISCSVQTIARLYKGDTVNAAQREPNRTLWLRSGYSYFGFVKLSS